MIRSIQDADLISSIALPAAAASASCVALDLGLEPPEEMQLRLSVPAVPALVDTKTITYTFEDSANNSSFAAIPELATVVSTGAASAGAAAVERTVYLPPSARRYVRTTAAVVSGGGDNTGVSMTLAALF